MKSRLKKLAVALFQCDEADLADDVGPGDVRGWDSLGHVALMAAIQQEFGLHVPVEDAIEVETLAELADILEGLSGSKA